MKVKSCIIAERVKQILARLNRIEGQIKGLKRMVNEKRYCVDILQQISSVHEALRGTAKILMRNYLEVCATDAIRSNRTKKKDEIYNEMMDVIYKFTK